MKSLTHIIGFSALILFGSVLPHTATAQTVPPLVVVFESTPLFANVDFKPLDVLTRYVRVTNNTNTPQPLIIEAINKTGCLAGPYCLAEKLRVRVRFGAALLYNKTLKEFYNEGQVIIDPALPAGTTRQYDIEVTFESGPDDNNYQTLETGFDFLVGYQGADTVSSGEGGGGGQSGLQIKDTATSIATSTGGVLITWATSYPATSQVLYGLTSGGPYALNLALANYGYPSATPEDATKVTDHSVYISGLIPGETYTYRVVSHASPPTVGYELTFTVPKTEEFQASYASAPVGENPVPLRTPQVIADARVPFIQPPMGEEPSTFATVAGFNTEVASIPEARGERRLGSPSSEGGSSVYLGYVFAILAGLALSVFARLFLGRSW